MHILIATRRPNELSAFADALLRETGAQLLFADSWTNVLATVKVIPPAFVILDEGLAEGKPLELARQLVTVNAMINTAVVSPLGAEEFHEASEGLGILAPVPAHPLEQDGVALAAVFKRFM